MTGQKKVFITGATGFIGKSLTLKLAEEGKNVIALFRSESKTEGLEHPNIELFKGNITEGEKLAEVFQDCDQVYHLAALANLWAKDPMQFTRVNFDATVDLLDAAKKAKVKKVVVTSTAGVIGPSNHLPVNEDTVRSAPYFGAYEQTKKLAEDYIRNYENGKMQVVMVNPTRVYGPGALSVSNGVTRMVKLYLQGKFRMIPGRGDKIGNYVYVDDVVDGHLLAMKKGVHGERYLLGGENIVYREFFDKITELTGKKFNMVKIPASVIFAMARMMAWRADLLGIPPLLTPDWARKFISYDWEVSSQKAVDQLGYKITSLQKGLEQTISWLEKEGHL